MATLTLTINGRAVVCPADSTILEAADTVGIYIPRMCHHPDLPPADEVVWADAVYQAGVRIDGDKPGKPATEEAHCNLCLVEVEGRPEPVNSCVTPVEDGLVVHTDTDEVVGRRQQALGKLLADHPHACLTCAQKEGCSRTDCSSNVPVPERCCVLMGRCELEKVSGYIGIPGDTPKYVPQQRPRTESDPLFDRDYELCIGCLRCVRVCQKLHGGGILGAVWKNDRAWVGTLRGDGLQEAQCRFCGACVEVCPTGALRDKEGVAGVRRDAPLPCAGSCPAGIDIPRYVRAVAEGRYKEAMEVIRSRTPLPGVLGYVCFRPCESACRRKDVDQAVAICDLKRFAADAAWQTPSPAIEKDPGTGKKVAIIGSGPAGITAAYYLCLLGHHVNVYDREALPGGMLRYGIPDYRLPPEILEREIKAVEAMGVEFCMNHRFDGEHWLDELKVGEFDAVLVAVGASMSKALAIENSHLEGIYPGLEFLKSAKVSQEPRLGGRVVVIGGGNVAIDAAMTAVRLGADSVCLVCLESQEEMPAHNWEVNQAMQEGVEIHPSWGPKRFMSDQGRVSGVELKRCTSVFDQQGRFAPQYDEKEITQIRADHVIVAIGQQVDSAIIARESVPSKALTNGLKTDEEFVLGKEGIFAAGDAIRGPSSVVDAVADGRQVADAIDRYLGGEGIAENDYICDESNHPEGNVSWDVFSRPRHTAEMASIEERKRGFGLIQPTLSEEAARSEAQRCLRCYLRQMMTPVVLPPELWLPLTEEAVDAVPEAGGAVQLLNDQKKVISIAGVEDMRKRLKERLKDPGDVRWFIYEEDPMYTKRESELIQRYLQEHGELPGGGGGDDDLDDLF